MRASLGQPEASLGAFKCAVRPEHQTSPVSCEVGAPLCRQHPSDTASDDSGAEPKKKVGRR